MEGEDGNGKGINRYEEFGFIPAVIRVAETANDTFANILNYPIMQTLTLLCFAIKQQKIEEIERQKLLSKR